ISPRFSTGQKRPIFRIPYCGLGMKKPGSKRNRNCERQLKTWVNGGPFNVGPTCCHRLNTGGGGGSTLAVLLKRIWGSSGEPASPIIGGSASIGGEKLNLRDLKTHLSNPHNMCQLLTPTCSRTPPIEVIGIQIGARMPHASFSPKDQSDAKRLG